MGDLIDRDAAIAAMAPHLRSLITRAQAVRDLLALPAAPVQCCMCGKRDLSTVEGDGGTECELPDGRWTCSHDCWDRATATPAPTLAEAARVLADAISQGKLPMKRVQELNCGFPLAALRALAWGQAIETAARALENAACQEFGLEYYLHSATALVAQIERLLTADLQAKLDAAEADKVALVEALEWYADPVNYERHYAPRPCGCCSDDDIPAEQDAGDKARVAILAIAGGDA